LEISERHVQRFVTETDLVHSGTLFIRRTAGPNRAIMDTKTEERKAKPQGAQCHTRMVMGRWSHLVKKRPLEAALSAIKSANCLVGERIADTVNLISKVL
jgi:hypothetical protein